jgi:hypothetical protein
MEEPEQRLTAEPLTVDMGALIAPPETAPPPPEDSMQVSAPVADPARDPRAPRRASYPHTHLPPHLLAGPVGPQLDTPVLYTPSSDPAITASVTHPYNKATTSVAGAVVNFVNAVIGAGLVGAPFALREAGAVVGVLLLFGVAALSAYTVQLIIRLGIQTHQHDYEQLCLFAFGRRGCVTLGRAAGEGGGVSGL